MRVAQVLLTFIVFATFGGPRIKASSFTSWGQESLEVNLIEAKIFFEELEQYPESEKIEKILGKDIRKVFFRLQSLANVYQPHNKALFKKLKNEFKVVEDVIGQLDLAKALLEQAYYLQEPPLISHFEKVCHEKSKDVLNILAKEGWLESPKKNVRRILHSLEKNESWNFGSESEQEYLSGNYLKMLYQLQEGVRNDQYNNSDIELGLHELRRDLRWLVIYINAFNGWAKLESELALSGPTKELYEDLKQKGFDLENSKYLRLDPPKTNQPLVFPAKMVGIASALVKEVGQVKEHAEMKLYIDEAATLLGYSGSARKTLQERLDVGHVIIPHQELARQYQDLLMRTQLLPEISKWFKKENEF